MDYDLEARADAAAELALVNQGGSGQEITVHQPAVTTYNPATDTTTVVTPAQNHTSSGVELKYDAFSIAQGVVAAGDIRFLLSPLKSDGSLMPEAVADSWTATLGGKGYTIKRVIPTRPAGNVIMYELQLRG